jgi:hypothetical protein
VQSAVVAPEPPDPLLVVPPLPDELLPPLPLLEEPPEPAAVAPPLPEGRDPPEPDDDEVPPLPEDDDPPEPAGCCPPDPGAPELLIAPVQPPARRTAPVRRPRLRELITMVMWPPS